MAYTPPPWSVVDYERQNGSGLWIYQADDDNKPVHTVVDTTAIDVWPLSDDDRTLIRAAPVLANICKDLPEMLEVLLSMLAMPADKTEEQVNEKIAELKAVLTLIDGHF